MGSLDFSAHHKHPGTLILCVTLTHTHPSVSETALGRNAIVFHFLEQLPAIDFGCFLADREPRSGENKEVQIMGELRFPSGETVY